MKEVKRYLKIKDLNPFELNPLDYFSQRVSLLETEYTNLLMNAVHITGLSYDVEAYVKYNLIEQGQVGYDKITNKWGAVTGTGINEIGNPTQLRFIFRNGKTFTRTACYEPMLYGSYLINALPLDFSLGDLIRRTCEFMVNCDIAVKQNIDACKTPYIVTCKTKDLLLSLKQALQEKNEGQAAIVVDEALGDSVKSVNINTNFLADKFLEVRDTERDKLLNKLGIMSANINKRERVQVGEVNATLGQCTDYIYLLIDTFNEQMKTYGLDYKMEINGSLEELYTDNQETETNEEKGEEND